MEPFTTSRLQLPLLAAGQAQKEVTHNEALIQIDSLLFPHVEGAEVNTPPADPVLGQGWIIGSAPIGAWQGRAHHLAVWSAGGWRYMLLPVGSAIPVGNPRKIWRSTDTGWRGPSTIMLPAGGASVDMEARQCLESLAHALADYGVIVTD